mgnify:CR=1 FL=1
MAVSSASSSAANSQLNGHIPESTAITSAGGETVTRKKANMDEDHSCNLEKLTQLEAECQEALCKIVLDPMSRNAVMAEKILWNSFIKQHKSQIVSSIFMCCK